MSTQYSQGSYKGVIIQQGFTTSREKGTLSFDIVVTVKEKIDPITMEGSPVTEARRTINHWITPTNLEPGKPTYEAFKAIGVYGEFEDYDPANPNHRSLAGTEVKLYCKHEEYQGKPKERWMISTGSGKPVNDPNAVAKLKVLSLPPLPPPAVVPPKQEQQVQQDKPAPPAAALPDKPNW
jgi:hypothetical protein